MNARKTYTSENNRRQQELYDKLKELPPPKWLIDMHNFYNKHRYFRAEDLF